MHTATTNPGPSHPGLDILNDLTTSGGAPQDLTNQQIPILRSVFEDRTGLGLWLFAYYICGCTEITMGLHWEMCQFLSNWGYIDLPDPTSPTTISRHLRWPREGENPTASWRRLMVCIPRDCFKTTLGTRSTALWTATIDPEVTVGIFNESEAKAKSWIGSIKHVIENSVLYHTLWPERLPPGVHYKDSRSVPRSWKWGDTGLMLPRQSFNVSELTFEPFGIGGSAVGKHFTHKIYDDIIGEKSATSAAIMDDAIHFVDHGRAIERPSDNGCELINCTRWAYFDVYSHMLRKWPNDYQVYHRSLLENPTTGEPDVVDGKSIFPERFPTSKCKTMYEADHFEFMSQRQCIPQAGRETSFSKDWVRYGEVVWHPREPYFEIMAPYFDPTLVHADISPARAPNRVPLSWLDKAIILDPAPTKRSELSQERRARNGIMAVAMDPWGRRIMLESVPLREDPVTVLEAIITLCSRWGTDRVGIEEVNFSAVYAPLWTAIIQSRYPRLNLEFIPLLTEGIDKDARIRAMQGPHKEGLWYYNRPSTGYVVQELLEYPNSETRDLVDAMAYTDRILIRPETVEESLFGRYLSSQHQSTRDRITGY